MTTYTKGEFPKACGCCGKSHSEAEWRKLFLCGYTGALVGVSDTLALEMRNCECGSTLAVEVVWPSKLPKCDTKEVPF